MAAIVMQCFTIFCIWWQDKTVHRKTAFKKRHWKNIPIQKHSKGQNGPPKNTTSKTAHLKNGTFGIFQTLQECVFFQCKASILPAHYSPYNKIVIPELLPTHMRSLTYSGTKYSFFEGRNLWIVV